MCGFTGVLKKNTVVSNEVLTQMIAKIKHRGPDDQGIWIENNIGLAHARLSILDLSAAGHQPMFSFSKRFAIAFNGEIYNYLALKKELEQQFSCVFMTHSDTEMLVNAIELWGIDKTLAKCTGMFAFAAWDRQTKLLYLARDRFGEKPLYYGNVAGDFVFSSELKPIQAVYKDQLHINRDALATYMRYSYVPTPSSIYNEIKKLEPGTYLTLDPSFTISQKTYWSAIEVALQAKKSPAIISFDEAVNQLEDRLKNVLAGQMLSDVPLGAFLSGGVDSSTVVALMQSQSNRPVKTFSVGFNERKYDESGFAKAVAEHLGTDHTELRVTDQDALAVIPMLGRMYDEPFADSSQIPTFLVSQLSKKHVTVALSGDGGDEVFGGYNRYFLAHRLKKILGNPVINTLIKYTPEKIFDLLDYFPQKKIAGIAQKFKKVQNMAHLFQGPFSEVYDGFCTQHFTKNSLVLSANESSVVSKKNHIDILPYFSEIEWMMLIDALTYLNDDILTKVDRAAMAVSLETRVPFLDHTLFEFAWSLPEAYKIKSGSGKRVLKEVLYRHVPKQLIDRPKMGFGIPYGEWLRGSLASWAQDLLNEQKLHQQGYLNASLVNQYLQEHLSGKRSCQGILWNVLMFQQWLEEANDD
jgi:asparagine synthase (glutamine-hydrolysing)